MFQLLCPVQAQAEAARNNITVMQFQLEALERAHAELELQPLTEDFVEDDELAMLQSSLDSIAAHKKVRHVQAFKLVNLEVGASLVTSVVVMVFAYMVCCSSLYICILIEYNAAFKWRRYTQHNKAKQCAALSRSASMMKRL
jgi:hypothetical protein